MANLSKGTINEEVKDLQELLNRHGNALRVDGNFGDKTEDAVIAFQEKYGLEVNGIVSDEVWTALWDFWLLTVTFSNQSDNNDVIMLQKRLNQFGFQLEIDGLFGTQTNKALRHYQALRRPVSDFDSQYIENLHDGIFLDKQNKKDSLVHIANIMLNDGYELAYVAGMMANAYHEGNTGQFESSKYTDESRKPEYLKFMDDLYQYRELYSGKTIMNVSLSEVEKLVNKLAQDKWENGQFGLGSIQWTGNRCQKLVGHYKKAAKNCDTITEIQALQAEGNFILEELKDVKQGYISIYPDWREANSNKLDSSEAADKAAQALCLRYEIPFEKEAKALERGKTAIEIYNIMAPTPVFAFSPKKEQKEKKKKKMRLWFEKIKKKLCKSCLAGS